MSISGVIKWLIGVVLKIMDTFGYKSYYGITYLGVPKWDPNLGSYP